MNRIDFSHCTMPDVIARSALLHPTLFAEALEAVAKTHREAAHSARFDRQHVQRIARDMAINCENMAAMLRLSTLNTSTLSFGQKVQAFGVAVKLQCIPNSTAQNICEREDEARELANV